MELFPVTQNDILKIQEAHGVDQNQINSDVKIVKDWMSKQQHLPQKLQCDLLIEKILLHTKYSVERTKEKIDNYFTLRNANKEFWEIFDQNENFLLPSLHPIRILPLPKLGPDMERIYVIDIKKDGGSEFKSSQLIQCCIAFAELMVLYDWANGLSIVADCRSYSLDYLVRSDLPKLGRLATFLTVHMHDNFESLHKMLPEQHLPVELGGTAGSLSDIMTKNDDVILNHTAYFKDCLNYVADESLRIGKSKYDPAFGPDGTFKKLNVD